MSVRLMSSVLRNVRGLPSGQRLLLVVLADFANDEGYCWPSIGTLARHCDMTERHVSALLKELQRAGYLAIGEQRGRSNAYWLAIPEGMNSSSGVNCTSGVNSSSGGDELHFTPTPELEFRGGMNSSSPKPSIEPSYRTVKEPSVVREQRGTRAPAAYAVTEEMVAWAGRTVGYGRERCEAEVEAFLDYHRAKGSVMKDWDAAFRTWIRNSTKFGRGAPGPKRMTPQEAMEEQFAMIERVAAEIEGTAFVVETEGRVK